MHTAGHTVDYVRPGALPIPARFRYLPDHVEPFPPLGGLAWLTAFLDLLSFIPLGFLLVLARNRPLPPTLATLLAAALAVALAAGKFLFDGRHTAVLNIVLEAVGGLLGALLAWRLVHARRTTPGPSR